MTQPSAEPSETSTRLRPVPKVRVDDPAESVDPDDAMTSGLTPQQAEILLLAHRRMLRRARTSGLECLLQTVLAGLEARQHAREQTVDRADRLVETAAERLAQVPVALRPLPGPVALLITVLLMFASFVTIRTILAAADVGPREATLLPLAFGPVFVLTVKTAVGAVCDSSDPGRRPGGQRRVVALLVPALLVAVTGLVAGVGLKAMALGAVLDEDVTAASSALMFAALVLGELVGAGALALHQYCPGARLSSDARLAYRLARLGRGYAHRRLARADGRVRAARRSLGVLGRWRSGRARTAMAAGWARAARRSQLDDELMRQISIEPVRLALPESEA